MLTHAGEVMEIPKAVCLHEEDAGVLWKHMDYRTGHAEVRRSRRLVLSFISTVVNYEYAFYWYFYQVSHCWLLFFLSCCLWYSGNGGGLYYGRHHDHRMCLSLFAAKGFSGFMMLLRNCKIPDYCKICGKSADCKHLCICACVRVCVCVCVCKHM